MQLVPPEDLGSIVHLNTILLKVPTLSIGKHMFVYNFVCHSTSTLEHAPSFLKCMVNEHEFMNLVSLSQLCSPH